MLLNKKNSFFKVFLFAAVLSLKAEAAESRMPKMVLVSTQKVMENSIAFKKAMAVLEIKRKQAEEEFNKIQNQLEKDNNALMALRSTLPEEKFAEKKKAFDKKVMEFQNSAQEKRRELESTYQNIVAILHENLQKILSDMSQKGNFDYVLDEQLMVWKSESVANVTDAVIKVLNQKLQDLSLKNN